MAEVLAFESRSIDDVEETWRRFVPSAQLERVDPRTFGFRWASAAMADFSVVSYDLAASVHSAIDPSDQVMACRVASRGGWVGGRHRDLNPGMPWLATESPVRARWADRAQVRALVFDRVFLDETARQLTGDDRFSLRAGDGAPRTRELAEHWERVHHHVSAGFSAGLGAGDSGALIEADLRRHAVHTTLAVFSPAFAEAMERTAQRTAAPRAVRRAVAFVEAHAHEPVTVDDIARAAGISTRGLQYAFHRALGTTPTEYLRRERLARAHAELRDGTRMPVAEVARRWGFASPSRFAKYYREAYGRTPSQTARAD